MDEIVIQNDLREDGTHVMHVMSTGCLTDHWLLKTPFADRAEVKKVYQDEVHLWHLVMEWSAREPVRGFIRGSKEMPWPMVLWALQKGERISEQIKVAARAHFNHYKVWPDFAWLRELPNNIQNGDVLNMEENTIILLQADWVPRRFIYVGCRRGCAGV